MALTDKLTAIADATRAKTGITNQMTLDEIATAINGISIQKGIGLQQYSTQNISYSRYRIEHSSYSDYIDANFPIFIVFGCYITGINGMVGKILRVDRNESTIDEISFGSSGKLYYSMSDTEIAISTNSNQTMRFSQTSTPGRVNLFGVKI